MSPWTATVLTVGDTRPGKYDEVTERLWPDPQRGPWELVLLWERRNGRPEPVGMKLLPTSSGEVVATLQTSTIRNLKIAEIAAEERERLAYVAPEPPSAEERIEGMRESTVRRLRRVAEIYKDAWQAGENPTKAVSRRMNITAPAAGNLVKRARDAGLLPPTTAGRPQA